MPLLRLDKASLNFGTHVLLDEVDFEIKRGARIGLLGRNGSGKTTLMKVIEGIMGLDGGERWLRPGPSDHPRSASEALTQANYTQGTQPHIPQTLEHGRQREKTRNGQGPRTRQFSTSSRCRGVPSIRRRNQTF